MKGKKTSKGPAKRKSKLPEQPVIPEFLQNLFDDVVAPPLLYGCGYTEDDLRKPRVGIANTWTELNPGHVHLDAVAARVREGVKSAGMTPFGFNTIAPCDGLGEGHDGMKFILPARDIIAASIEIMARVNRLQGLVLIGSCDKIVPGLLMAAARLDIPSIIVTGGYHLPYCCPDQDFAKEKEFAYYEIGKFYFAHRDGKISDEEFRKAVKGIVTGPGACPMIGTAVTMQCMTEALGMALPYSSILPGTSDKKMEFAEKSGRALRTLIDNGVTPSRIMTPDAFKNAVTVLLSMGGSTNGFLHLPAIAGELGIRLPMELFDELSGRTPLTCMVKPNGLRAIEIIDEAGGMPAVMKNLAPLLNLDVMTVTGETLGENLRGAAVKDAENIRPLGRPFSPDGGLVVLRGTLAPGGAIVKKSAITEKLFRYRGPARVFESEEGAIAAMFANEVKPGECVVIRYEGPRGGPGMREMSISGHLMQLFGLGESGALITDARFSGTNYGLLVGHISPEAADGGPLALVRDGDIIEIDITKRRMDLKVGREELARRRKRWKPPVPRYEKGLLSWYTRIVSPAYEGAVWKGK